MFCFPSGKKVFLYRWFCSGGWPRYDDTSSENTVDTSKASVENHDQSAELSTRTSVANSTDTAITTIDTVSNGDVALNHSGYSRDSFDSTRKIVKERKETQDKSSSKDIRLPLLTRFLSSAFATFLMNF